MCIIYITKCFLFNLYYVAYMYIVRGDHLALENQLVCPSLRKTISLVLSKPVFCLGMRLCGFSPPAFTSIGVIHVQLMFRQSC